jgi:L-ascorbate metabolism protein UlaG (beta-lactamase superfamily)
MNNDIIKFINHACIQYKNDKINLLFDPWFKSKVFNDSWALLKESEISKTDFSSVTHICVSHEHPDHLHFETLKELLEINKSVPTLIFPSRTNEFVKSSLRKTGFDVIFISRDGKPIDIGGGVNISYFGEEDDHDNSIVLATNKLTILNQNDHYTSDENIDLINQKHPKIDYLFTQFSLAGYYHIDRLIRYTKAFKPRIVVPFASYVYFCHPYNRYLNDYIVTPSMVYKILSNYGFSAQFPYFGDEITSDTSRCEELNKISLPKLNNLFDKSNFKINESYTISKDQLILNLTKTLNTIAFNDRLLIYFKFIFRNFIKGFDFPKLSTFIYIEDIDLLISWNILTNNIEVKNFNSDLKIDLYAVSSQFNFMVKFPFGTDTFNISACHRLTGKNSTLLQQLLVFKNRSHYI